MAQSENVIDNGDTLKQKATNKNLLRKADTLKHKKSQKIYSVK